MAQLHVRLAGEALLPTIAMIPPHDLHMYYSQVSTSAFPLAVVWIGLHLHITLISSWYQVYVNGVEMSTYRPDCSASLARNSFSLSDNFLYLRSATRTHFLSLA